MGVAVGVGVLVGSGVSVGVLDGTGVSVGVTVGVLVGVSVGTAGVSNEELESNSLIMPTSVLTTDMSGVEETSTIVSASKEAEEVEEMFSATGALSGWKARVGADSKDSTSETMATDAELDVGVRVGKGVRVSVGKRVKTTMPSEVVPTEAQANVTSVKTMAAR